MRIAIVVASPIKPDLPAKIERGESPRRDYFELQQALGATLINVDRPFDLVSRLLWRTLGRPAAHAWLAFRRRNDYDVVHTLSEDVGLILALLFKLLHVRRRHVMVAHYLTPRKKRLLFRLFHLETHIDKIVVYSTPQERVALDLLRLPAHKVVCVLHPADHIFWHPQPEAQREMICSAGLEFRDYPTLLAAVADLPVEVMIAAASPWSKRPNETSNRSLPHNVQTVSLSPFDLRRLYSQARFVVVPLYDVDFQAGSLVMYEAMACGKAIIATRTRGQEDILRPGETGMYVAPDNAVELRTAIITLLNDPESTATMGKQARHTVEQRLNLQHYIHQMTAIILDVAEGQPTMVSALSRSSSSTTTKQRI